MAQWGTTESDEQPIRGQRIFAPWTDEQVTQLNAWQQSGYMHPFTCGGSVHDGNVHGERPALFAERDGWVCPDTNCDYRQNWAHSFMASPEVLTNMNDQHNRLLGEFFDSQRQRARAFAKRRAESEPVRSQDTELVERACEVMHDAYEKAALGAGWATNPASRKPWADVPEANKQTMRAAVGALLDWLQEGAP